MVKSCKIVKPRVRPLLVATSFFDELSAEIDNREFIKINLSPNRISQLIKFYKSEFQRYSLLRYFLMEEELITDKETEYPETGYFNKGIDKLWDDMHLMIAVVFGFRVNNGTFAWNEDLLPRYMNRFLPPEVKYRLQLHNQIPNFRRIVSNDGYKLTEFLESTIPPEPISNDIIIDTLMGADYSQSMKYEILVGLNKTEGRPNPAVIAPTLSTSATDGTPQTPENVTAEPPQRPMEMIPNSVLTLDEQQLKEYFLRIAYRKRLIVQWLYTFGILGEYHHHKAVEVEHLSESSEDDGDGNNEDSEEDEE